MTCILCGGQVGPWFQENQRQFLRCGDCSFIFVPRDRLLSPEDEKKIYDHHENHEDDPRYREYLNKITVATVDLLAPQALGLDYGCGESTLLAILFNEVGFEVDSYDLYYHPEEKFRTRSYDFIVLSEVIEHLREPLKTMKELRGLLRPNGQFFIKTKFAPDEQELFAKWHYKNDPTHIQFFNLESMEELARSLGMHGPARLECTDLCRFWS